LTALLLTACVGMITGAFLIFRISPMDFTLGVFRRLTAGPKSIRDEINETTHRKKPGFFRREISEAQTILQATGKEERFPMLCAASLLLFAVGAGIAIIMNNLLLVPVLAAGMMFLPFWYFKLTAGHYRRAVTAELETALSIITTAYLRSEDLQTAVEENINYLNPPVYGVFRSFLTRIKHIDPDMNAALAELKSAIDNEVWRGGGGASPPPPNFPPATISAVRICCAAVRPQRKCWTGFPYFYAMGSPSAWLVPPPPARPRRQAGC